MTKEEFRQRLMQSRNNTSDKMTEAVVDFMVEMKSVDYEAVLDMPSRTFDLYLEGFARRAEIERRPPEREGRRTFG